MTVKALNSQIISIPPRPSSSDFQRALSTIERSQDEIVVAATSIQFATPMAVCGLRATLDAAAAVASRVVLACPAIPDVHRYLTRVDVYADLPPNVEMDASLPILVRRERDERLIELVRVRNADDVEALMDRVSRVAGAQLQRAETAIACATAIGAATENVIDHAQSPIGALVCAQRYSAVGLEIAVVDLGLGIPVTLAGNPRHADMTDLAALELALQDGISSSTERGRGAGLAGLLKGVASVGNATLRLAAGRGELVISWKDGRELRYRTIPNYAVRGTWIQAILE
jgi:hypothetical protein